MFSGLCLHAQHAEYKSFGIDKGLADETVRAAYSHPNGLIYIGTGLGLSVFDGNNIININTGITQEVKSIYPYLNDSILLVRDHAISIINMKNYGYREKDFHEIANNKFIEGLVVDSKVYCITNDGLVSINIATLGYENLSGRYKQFPHNIVTGARRCMVYSPAKQRLYVTHRNGLIAYDIRLNKLLNTSETGLRLLTDTTFYTGVFYENGFVYFKRQNSFLFRFDEQKLKTDTLKLKFVSGRLAHGKLLYVNRKYFVVSDLIKQSADTFYLNETITINCIEPAGKNGYIFGTPKGILTVRRPAVIATTDSLAVLSKGSKQIDLQKKFQYGRYLLFNKKTGIIFYDTVSGTSYFEPLKNGVMKDIYSFFPYKHGHLIITGINGYCGFDIARRQFYKPALFSDSIEKILKGIRTITGNYDSVSGHILITTYGRGIYLKNTRNGTEKNWDLNSRKWFKTVRCLYHAGGLEYFLGANGNDGLINFNFETEKGYHVSAKIFSRAGNNSAVINQIIRKGSNLYLATADGLAVVNLNNRSVRSVSVDGFPYHDQVYAISLIGNDLFATTRHSLCKLASEFDLVRIFNYSNYSGGGIPFSNGGKILVYVRDMLITVNLTAAGKLVSPDISHVGHVGNWHQVLGNSKIEFPYGSGSLQVNFFSPDYSLSQAGLRVMYRFSGSQRWQVLRNFSFETGNLNYGEHIIEYYGIYYGQTGPIKKFTIIIARPWWATGYFYFVSLISVLLLAFIIVRLIVKRKIRAEREQMALVLATSEKERNRIGRDFHDGVGVKLSTIKLYAESIRAGGGNDIMSQLPSLVDEILVDVRQIINQLSPPALRLYGIKLAISSLVSDLNAAHPAVNFVFSCDDEIPRFAPDAEIHIYRICQELLNNSVKHSACSKIQISLKHQADSLLLEIADNGVGMNGEKALNGHGLANIRARMDVLEGQFSIHDQYPTGTLIKIILPLKGDKPQIPDH